jgi:hypothetical protein
MATSIPAKKPFDFSYQGKFDLILSFSYMEIDFSDSTIHLRYRSDMPVGLAGLQATGGAVVIGCYYYRQQENHRMLFT